MLTTQNKQSTLLQTNEIPFALSVLKGSIGKSVIETYFNRFGYEIYPFGYENHYANITRFTKRDPLDKVTTMVRAMPDLLVFDRVTQESYLVEIKTSNSNDVSKYWIEKDHFDTYKNCWPEALLAVYSVCYGGIYCNRISDIKNRKEGPLPGGTIMGYYFDLRNFHDLPYYFQKIDLDNFSKLCREIQKILETFGHTVVQQRKQLVHNSKYN